MCTNGARTGTTRIITADHRSEIPQARIKACGAPPAVDRGGTYTPCAVSRCAASSIRPSAITITGSAWREAYEARFDHERTCSMAPTQPRHDDIIIRRRFGEHASTHAVKQ